MLRGETGFPQADVENDFLRARRRQVADRLAHSVHRRPGRASRLVPLDEVVGALGRRGERPLGLQAIRLATIVGTLDARREFDHRFRPTSNRVRSRYTGWATCTSSKTGITECRSPWPHTRR